MTTVADVAPTDKLPPAVAADLRIVLAALQAKKPHLADVLSRANAVLMNGRLFPGPDGQEALVTSTGKDGQPVVYHVGEGCDCPEAAHHQGDLCKHYYAFELWKIVQKRLARHAHVVAPSSDGHAEDVETGDVLRIPREFLERINGKPFVKCDGLVKMAHERGLESLETTVVHVDATMAVCQCVARFRDGLVVTDVGDATPDNVKSHLKTHFPRIAATRATARALRRALNIAAIAVEELGEGGA